MRFPSLSKMAVVLTLALVAACSSKPEEKIRGRWAVDVEAMVTRDALKDQLAGLNADAQEKRLAAARAEAARIVLEIDAEKLVVDTGLDHKETRYTVRTEGDGLVLDTDDGAGQKGALNAKFEGDRLRMTWSGTELLFVKK